MLYDINVRIEYDYETQASGARHIMRIMPLNLGASQRLIAGTVSMTPDPAERTDFYDFFGNTASSLVFRSAHEKLDIRMKARVQVEAIQLDADLTTSLSGLAKDLSEWLSLDGASPHHYLAESPLLARNADIAAYASTVAGSSMSVRAIAQALCSRIYEDFSYDPEATEVDTLPGDAFKLKKGVCQDFTHIMIIALRSLGIPAGYVSGYLRTIPPPGKERLEGADAMHAWVRVWCGRTTGWMELDPTNNIVAAADHIRAGFGRDYSDVAPVIGVSKSSGSHTTEQTVDVIPL